MNKNLYKKFICLILTVSISGILSSGCNKDDSSDAGNEKYSATVAGYGGDVTVEVTATEDGKIGTMKVDASKETPEIGGTAAPKIVKAIVAKQSLSVDAISGATITSKAVLSAAETALIQAGVDTEALKNK